MTKNEFILVIASGLALRRIDELSAKPREMATRIAEDASIIADLLYEGGHDKTTQKEELRKSSRLD